MKNWVANYIMQSKTEKSFLKNTDAYIPFAVIGIFIVLGAILTSVYFVKMDYEIAQTIYDTDQTNPKQTATNLAAADLSRALNYAGMDALKWQGEHPIIQPDGTPVEQSSLDGFSATIGTRDLEPGDTVRVSINLPRDVWGKIESIWEDKSVILIVYDSSGTIIETIDYGEAVGILHTASFDDFITLPDSPSIGYGYIELKCGGVGKATDWFSIGMSPIKDITAEHLNKLIAGNYQYNLHTFDQYAINVEPDIKPEQIIIHKVNGTLDRELDHADKVYTIYYNFEIRDLNYTLVDLVTNETTNHTTTISSLITSREPLLAELATEYENELKTGTTQNIVLGAANIRTFSYGPWQHYAKGPLNILTNPALASAINAGTVYTQKKVFDSVDPWSLMFTTYYNGKVLYQDVRGDAKSYDETKSVNLTTTYDKLAADKSFSIDVEGGISDSMADSGTTLTQVSDESKITVAASDYTQGVLDGWVFNDRLDRWSGSNDLLHDITNDVYKADVQAQVARDGFDSIMSSDPDISASSGSVSHGTHTVSWSESYAVSGRHTAALASSYGWSDSKTNSYSQSVNPSINPPHGSVKSWRITSASVSLRSVDATDVNTDPFYTHAGEDNITETHRTDGYLDWEKHKFDWLIRYGIGYNIRTTWSISYNYDYTYGWNTRSTVPNGETTKTIIIHHTGSGSGSSSTSASKLDSESLSHSETETEHLTITYHKRPPTGGYSGLETYSDPTAREYRETIVDVNGVEKLDKGCSDAADKYSAQHVNVYDIESKHWLFPDGAYLVKKEVQCDVPDWLHKVMADEVLDMVDSIDSDDPSVSFSLLDNLGADPTKLRADAADELVADLEHARTGYVDKSKHQDGAALYTSSDAAQYVAKNEAYNKLITDIEEENKALTGGLNEYVLKKLGENGINISSLTGVKSGKLSLFDNPAIKMAGNALGAEMGIIDTMKITGMPESKYNWTEDMTVMIDQYPDYLYHDPKFDLRDEYLWFDKLSNKTIYPLGVRNTCIFTTGIADNIADVVSKGTGSANAAVSQMVSQSISDLNVETTALMTNLSEQGITFDTDVLDYNLDNLKQKYSSQMKLRIPIKIAEQVAADPVVSGWIGSDDVKLIASRYLNGLSNRAIIDQSSGDTLSNEILSRIRMQIIGSDHSIGHDEMDAVLNRVDTDVRVGVSEGISVVIVDNSKMIDDSFEEINNELQKMLDKSTDKLSDEVAEKVSKRLEKTMNMVPAGLPLIPPNWVFTINVWTYDVVGEYQTFRVIDNDNEVIFDPYFGHVGQVYVRKEDDIYHPIKKDEFGFALSLGKNTPVRFKFNGYASTIVGPSPKGVGDKIGGRTEISTGYDDLLLEYGA